jgi:hypothetical protein
MAGEETPIWKRLSDYTCNSKDGYMMKSNYSGEKDGAHCVGWWVVGKGTNICLQNFHFLGLKFATYRSQAWMDCLSLAIIC